MACIAALVSLGDSIARLQPAFSRWASADGDRAILILLAVFVAMWTMFDVISYASVGLHPDMTEAYAWGRHLEAGYYKHPPLLGWMTAAWFSLFPVSDWAFDLLATVNASAALYATDLIARRYLPVHKRLMVPLFLLMTPFYQFHAQRFGANQTLLATWPIAVYCSMRAFEDRTVLWSIAAGVGAAVAMLGKYYSIYLVGGIAIAAFTQPYFARYLKSPLPWISIISGLLILVPHIRWLVISGYLPIKYAYENHIASSSWSLANSVVSYLIGAVAYVALPIAVYFVVVRPNLRSLGATLWPADPKVRMLVAMLAGFLLLPPITAPFLGVKLTSLWTMSIWFVLPIILLAPEHVVWPQATTVRAGIALFILAAIADTLVAPTLAWIRFTRPNDSYRVYTPDLSDLVTQAWHARVDHRLTIVMGVANLSDATTFYSRDHPDSVPHFDLRFAPWVTPGRLDAEGWMGICPDDDANCLSLLPNGPRAETREIVVTPHFLGFKAPPARFVMTMIPPRDVRQREVPQD